MPPRTYPHPRPRLLTVRLALMLVPFCAGICAAGMRTAAAANLHAYLYWLALIVPAVVLGNLVTVVMITLWRRSRDAE